MNHSKKVIEFKYIYGMSEFFGVEGWDWWDKLELK
jgi:hypothetical protein